MVPLVGNVPVRETENAVIGDVENDLEVVIGSIENVAETEIENETGNVIVKEKETVIVIGSVIIVNRIPEKDHAAERETVIEKEIESTEKEAEKKVRHVSQPGQEQKKNRQRRLPSRLPRRLGIMTIATESVNETEIENENQAEDHLNEKENLNANENGNGKEIVVMKERTLRIGQDIRRIWRTIIVE